MERIENFGSKTLGCSSPAATTVVAFLFCIALSLAAIPTGHAQTFTVIHSFSGGSDGELPSAGLTPDGSGNFYGSTPSGGTGCFGSGCGLVYRLAQNGSEWQISPAHLFLGQNNFPGDGRGPGGVTFGPDGDLYGGTGSGSWCAVNRFEGCGTVYKLHPTNCSADGCEWSETVLYHFQGGNDAEDGSGTLVFDQAGNLYGTSFGGGGSRACYQGCGTVYTLAHTSTGWTESVIHAFGFGNDGSSPSSHIVLDREGNIYGTTLQGGLYSQGIVFELVHSPSGWSERILYQFQDGTSGTSSESGLIADAAGNLYGATMFSGGLGGGTVYELSRQGESWNFQVIHNFIGGLGFEGPAAPLFMDVSGNIYGTTWSEGPYNEGNVFELSPGDDGWTYTNFHEFTGGADGGNPLGQLTMDAAGNLYGTTYDGGNPTCPMYGCGVVFEVTR